MTGVFDTLRITFGLFPFFSFWKRGWRNEEREGKKNVRERFAGENLYIKGKKKKKNWHNGDSILP